MTQNDMRRATDTALRLLAQRSLSEVELRQRLQRREFDEEAINAAVASMVSYRYLDDARLAESVRAAAERRGKGPRWIHATLRRRGIEASLAERTAVVDADSQTAQALALLRTRFAAGLPDARTRQRAYRQLLSRGFGHGSVLAALQQHGRAALDDIDSDPIPQEDF